MYIPEFSITTEVLNNIANIEYGRALIDNNKVLPHWENKLKKEALIRTVAHSLSSEGFSIGKDTIKRYFDGMRVRVPQEVKNVGVAMEVVDRISGTKELDEKDIKEIYSSLIEETPGKSYKKGYRSVRVDGREDPEEILASLVALADWYNTLDAKQTHPVVVSAVIMGRLEHILPFESFNSVVSAFVARACLKIGNYGFKDFICLDEYFAKGKKEYDRVLEDAKEDEDFTSWLEYFTDVLSREVVNVKEKVSLLARDTKVAKVTGRVDLSERQEKLVEFMQDYGVLQNRDFGRIFPNISEDTVLRDLKVLIKKGIVAKRGKTKSSRYELR